MPGLSYYGYEDPNTRKNIYSTEGWLGAMVGGMGQEALGKGMAGGGMIFGRNGGLAARASKTAAGHFATQATHTAAVAGAMPAEQAYQRALQKMAGGGASSGSPLANQLARTEVRQAAQGAQGSLINQARVAKAKGTAAMSKSAGYAATGKKLVRSGRILMAATLFTTMYELGKSAVDAGANFRKTKEELAQARNKVYNEDSFSDSRAAFTQRQRAIQVIHNSQMGVRSAMGSEASYMHF
jgi:hypothetical protein